jgi:hypothetical protein
MSVARPPLGEVALRRGTGRLDEDQPAACMEVVWTSA